MTRKLKKSDGLLVLMIALGFIGVLMLARRIDALRPAVNTRVAEENLYVNAATVNRLSLSFRGLVADWYWMRSLQYVGNKIINLPQNVPLDNLGQLNLKLLAPLLDAATTLDPQFMEPYEYAAVVLPDVDLGEAIRIVKKGISANPNTWRLYHHLGYISWQQKDFKTAGEAYAQGAKLPGAPAWMEAMKARMASEGGSRDTAREIYQRMYEQATDERVKDMAHRRLLQLASFDEQDALRRLIAAYKANTGGRCPASWQDFGNVFRALRVRLDSSGAPLDPSGAPYILMKDKCDVALDLKSGVPAK